MADGGQVKNVLKEAAAQWQTTFDAVRDPLWLLDAEQRIQRSNRAAPSAATALLFSGRISSCFLIQQENLVEISCNTPPPTNKNPPKRVCLDVRIDFKISCDG